MDQEPDENRDEAKLIDQTRRRIAIRIANEMDSLINALFEIANNPEEDAKVRLSAIGMLLERSLPKLGVEHTAKEDVEESGGSRSMRAEIAALCEEEDE